MESGSNGFVPETQVHFIPWRLGKSRTPADPPEDAMNPDKGMSNPERAEMPVVPVAGAEKGNCTGINPGKQSPKPMVGRKTNYTVRLPFFR